MSSTTDAAFGRSRPAEDGEHWLTVSDLMAGLMIVFLFVAIALMRNTLDLANSYGEMRQDISAALKEIADKHDLTFDDEELTFEFTSVVAQFKQGKSVLQEEFKSKLDSFIPDYIEVVQRYEGTIEAVRIEGHTDSTCNPSLSERECYFHNMELSQRRAVSVLKYAYGLIADDTGRSEFVRRKVSAIGYSYSQLKYHKLGDEDLVASRRVVIRVVTSAESKIREIQRQGISDAP